MAKKHGAVLIEEGRCKGCGLCVIFCPEDVLAMAEDRFNVKGYRPVVCTEPAGCTGCGVCALVCPDVAFTVFREPKRRRDPVAPTDAATAA